MVINSARFPQVRYDLARKYTDFIPVQRAWHCLHPMRSNDDKGCLKPVFEEHFENFAGKL